MDEKLIQRFKEKAEAFAAEVYRTKDAKNVEEVLNKVFADLGKPVVGVAPSELINDVGVVNIVKKLDATVHDSDLSEFAADFTVGISELDIAIAENGTIAQNAVDLGNRVVSMLPDVHIAFIRTKNIVPGVRDAVEHFDNQGMPPGYIAFISGPSRTADIERVLAIGVHGPERLVIILVD